MWHPLDGPEPASATHPRPLLAATPRPASTARSRPTSAAAHGFALAVAAFLTAAAVLVSAATGAHAVTIAQAHTAAQRGAQWIATQQEEDGDLGSFGGDWSMTALAATGVNAADLRVSPLDPSAQDFYLSSWTSEGPGGAATDDERAILTGYAGGLQTTRLDARTNLVADLAAQFDGHQLGGEGATNADVFGLLALDVSGAPAAVIDTLAGTLREQQDADGGWNFAAGAGSSDVDMTGAAIAALCAAGATPQDPALARALEYLHAAQDPASGGFVSATLGLNTDTTGWVTSGLIRCGIDPQTWVTNQGKTPLDFLVAQQNPDGSFQWRAGDENEDLYATQDAVRPLAGAAFTAPAPARADTEEPAVRPTPTVAAGTPVPMTLVIDSGTRVSGGSSVRMCKFTAPDGATVAQALHDADLASEPAYCVSDLGLSGDRVTRLDGIPAEPGSTAWQVRREGGSAEAGAEGQLGLGALLELRLVESGSSGTGAPAASEAAGHREAPGTTAPAAFNLAPLSTPTEHRTSAPARLRVRARTLSYVRRGLLRVDLRCPSSTGVEGCRGLLRVRMTLRRRHAGSPAPRVVATQEVYLRAGTERAVTIALDAAARRGLRERENRLAWIVAAMRDPSSGAVTSAAASTVLR